jgi:hypothetical protein
MRNTIKLKSYLDVFNEYTANAAISPGMLVELMSTGKVRAHATSAGNVTPIMFAIEDALQGKGVEDAYAAGDVVRCWIPQRGDEVQALLADEQIVVVGDALMSNGQGLLTKFMPDSWDSADAQTQGTVEPNKIVAIALEAKDLNTIEGSESSGAGTAWHGIAVRIV